MLQADLRRQLAAEKKRTTKLEADLSKLTALHDSRLVDVKAFKSALQNRDDQIKAGEQRHAHAAAAAARAAQSMSQELSSVTRALLSFSRLRKVCLHACICANLAENFRSGAVQIAEAWPAVRAQLSNLRAHAGFNCVREHYAL